MNTVAVMKAVNTEPRRIKEAVLHFRQYTLQDDVPVLKNNGGYTLLIRKEGEFYKFSKARCGKGDNFNKSVGINIVRGRIDCKRRILCSMYPKSLALHELKRLNDKCREKYTVAFFEHLLGMLV